MHDDSLLEKIKQIKEKAKEEGESLYDKIVSNLEKVHESKTRKIDTFGADFIAKRKLEKRRNTRAIKRKAEIQIDDAVRIKTLRFLKSICKGSSRVCGRKGDHYKGQESGCQI